MAYKQLKLWFDEELAEQLATKILLIDQQFDRKSFAKAISAQIPPLELKDRIEVFADELYRHFNASFQSAIQVLLQILGPENEEETGMFKKYYWIMPIAKIVEKYGLGDFEVSIHAIEEITKRNTGEYAIRPYINLDPERTLSQMIKWSQHENKHVRRLSSEGVRPRLPWAQKLQIFIDDPQPIIPILDNLKDDPSKYVQKSVANCLNDILKDNLPIGKAIIHEWNEPTIGKERRWIIKHALRNLMKQNDSWATDVVK